MIFGDSLTVVYLFMFDSRYDIMYLVLLLGFPVFVSFFGNYDLVYRHT